MAIESGIKGRWAYSDIVAIVNMDKKLEKIKLDEVDVEGDIEDLRGQTVVIQFIGENYYQAIRVERRETIGDNSD